MRSWLEQNAPALAPLFEGAVHMVAQPGFPGRVHFVAHAMREIRNRLPDAITGQVTHRVQYSELTRRLATAWAEGGATPDFLAESDSPSATGGSTLPVSRDVVDSVQALLDAHESVGAHRERRITQLFAALGIDPVPSYAVNPWIKSSWGQWAEAFAHARVQVLSPEAEDALEPEFEAFESGLAVLVNRSFENMDKLDAILDSANR